jgi:hypothetical protein
MRRAILERFRVAHGAKRIRMLQTEHVARIISGLKPFAQRNLFKTLRGLLPSPWRTASSIPTRRLA